MTLSDIVARLSADGQLDPASAAVSGVFIHALVPSMSGKKHESCDGILTGNGIASGVALCYRESGVINCDRVRSAHPCHSLDQAWNCFGAAARTLTRKLLGLCGITIRDHRS